MSFTYLPNLSSSIAEPCEPWTAEVHRPSFSTKEEFRLWCNAPTTTHAFISAVEGRTPQLRVSEVNPPARMSGLVLDYDAIPPGPPAEIILVNAPGDLRPAYVSRTYSGNCRVIFRFEEDVPVFTPDIAKEFLKKAYKELRLRKLLPGFEQEAFYDICKYYEIGDQWTPVGDGNSVIPKNLLMAWLADASRKHQWDKEGPVISVEALREEGEKKFPAKWPGGWENFDIGARGPRFWDEGASDPTACIVRESGVQFFSDGGGFLSWEAIFGTAFVKKWSEDRRGNAIANLWFDGKNYWRKNPTGEWAALVRGDLALDLLVDKRLSPKPVRAGQPSEIDLAIYDIQTLKLVRGAMPFLYKQDGPTTYNGKRYLNTSTVRPIQPVNDVVDWGEGFPWLAQFLYTIFDPDDQLDYFIAWLRHFYLGALNGELQRGLALFIAGPAGAGKTILNRAVLGQLFGARRDAGAYLLGGDKYNDELFEGALWNVDDEVIASDPKQRAMFSQMVKKIVANDSFIMRAMYHSGVDLEWVGRIVVTMNDDAESLQMLPETEINILDKIMLLKTKTPDVAGWPTNAEIAAELPFFAAFLRDWVVPEHLIPPPNKRRFGVVSYKHPDLLRAAGSTSATSSFEELLLLWRSEWFAPGGPGAGTDEWVGSPTQLLQVMSLNESLRSIVDRNYSNPTSVGIHLNKLLKRGVEYMSSPKHRTYAIARETS